MADKKGATVAKPKALTKTEIIKEVAASVGLERRQVACVIDSIVEIANKQLSKDGPGLFKIAGLVQLKRVDKPAQPARRGTDPFTKVERDFPAKPAKSVVKASVMKATKDAVA